MEINQEDPSNLLRESGKLRLKEILERFLGILLDLDGERPVSRSFLAAKTELIRFIEEEKPHATLMRLIFDLCGELDRFPSGWRCVWDYVDLKKGLDLLMKECGTEKDVF